MAKDTRRTPPEAKQPTGERNTTPRMDQPFDHWLHKQLHEMYDAIAKEPLPDDLLRLIDQDKSDAAKSPASTDDKKKT